MRAAGPSPSSPASRILACPPQPGPRHEPPAQMCLKGEQPNLCLLGHVHGYGHVRVHVHGLRYDPHNCA